MLSFNQNALLHMHYHGLDDLLMSTNYLDV